MTERINLQQMERKAFRATFADGLTDISIGIVLLMFAIAPLLGDLGFGDFWSSMVFLPIIFVALFAKRLIKRKIIEPRLGTVTFHTGRKRKVKKIMALISLSLFLGIIAGILFWFRGPETPARWVFPGVFSILLLVLFSGSAFYLDLTRFYFYAFLSSLGVIAGELLFQNGHVSHHGLPVFFSITCAAMIVTGVILFTRFLSKYPKPEGETSHE